MEEFADCFIQGQKDCREGVEHSEKYDNKGSNDAYTRGYNTQYTAEQNDNWRTGE